MDARFLGICFASFLIVDLRKVALKIAFSVEGLLTSSTLEFLLFHLQKNKFIVISSGDFKTLCMVLFGGLAKKNLGAHKKYQEPESYNQLSCNQLP